MSKIINGEKWTYIGTTYDADFIYDMYENAQGEVIYEIIETRYQFSEST